MICFRCNPPESPQAVIVQKPLGGELCEKCGNAQYILVETIELIPPALEVVEVMEMPNMAVDETAVSFEEVNNMEVEELVILAGRLNLEIQPAELIDEVRGMIKDELQRKG